LIQTLRRRKPKKIEVILLGGLGNQLFQYFAGQYLAHKSKGVLKIDSTFSQFGRSGHSDWLNELTLSESISPTAPKHSFPYIKSLLKRRVRNFLAQLISSRDWQLRFLRQYHSPVIGFDPKLQEITPPVTLAGYFQTWRYYQALKDQHLLPEVIMKSPSSWFLNTANELDRLGKVLGIHVRRGDYVGNSDIGTLSVSYYEDAIKELKSRGVTWDAIWIFSDDLSLVQREFREFADNNPELFFVKPPKYSHSIESLLLMSRTSSLIIANSTYSWWAATLGNAANVIVCPAKWFVQMEDPQDLYPESWIRVPSSWVNLGP